MSLDISLCRNYHVSYDNGKTLELCEEELYTSNITHNLREMAIEAGIYEALWRPYRLKDNYDVPEGQREIEYKFEESNPVKAKEIINIIEKGLIDLKARPEYFERFNSPNGWGVYENFVPFVENYLIALKEYPEATVLTDR